jgi:acetoin utilization deacetylase AcuC-like enzyme
MMKIFGHAAHRAHEAKCELIPGELVPTIETVDRIGSVGDALAARGFEPTVDCAAVGFDELLTVHDRDYLDFLETAWAEWIRSYDAKLDGIGFVWPHRNRPPRAPKAIEGKLGLLFL